MINCFIQISTGMASLYIRNITTSHIFISQSTLPNYYWGGLDQCFCYFALFCLRFPWHYHVLSATVALACFMNGVIILCIPASDPGVRSLNECVSIISSITWSTRNIGLALAFLLLMIFLGQILLFCHETRQFEIHFPISARDSGDAITNQSV